MKWLVLLFVACDPHTWRDPVHRPDERIARLAIASGTQLRLLDIGMHGILAERSVELGKYVSKLGWTGAEPVALLSDTAVHAPPYVDQPVGAVAVGGDGVHALPAGEAVDDSAPQRAPDVKPGLQLAVAPRAGVDYLRCTDGTGHVVEIPDAPRDDFQGESKPVWLASEPPIFAAAEVYPGATFVEEAHIFIDCRADQHLIRWVASPSGVVAIFGDRLDVVYRGKVIGTSAGGELVAFAPSASATPAR